MGVVSLTQNIVNLVKQDSIIGLGSHLIVQPGLRVSAGSVVIQWQISDR